MRHERRRVDAVVTNLEARPAETVAACGPREGGVELVGPRDVPLGGPRAMRVRRTLPSRTRSMVGPFCFADHYGPDDVADRAGMDVPPHPHTGLQTVTWLFEGRVLHQDATGSVQEVRPGELSLMTAGRGIAHSEEGTTTRFPDLTRLHGVQLWTALPEAERHREPGFEHVADLPVLDVDGARVQVFLGGLGGDLAGERSRARAFSALVAAQVDLPAGAHVRLPVEPGFEHGVLVDAGDLTLAGAGATGTPVAPSCLAYVAPGHDALELVAGDRPVRAVLLGGEPFAERLLMWWNFVARTHEEVVEARAAWQASIAGDADARARFGVVPGYRGDPLPAPELPHVRLRPRDR